MSNQLIKKILGLGLFKLAVASSLVPYSPALSITSASDRDFALVAGNKVFVVNGGDFEGNPSNYSDDARIYAHNGFTMNNLSRVNLPTEKDSVGNTLTDPIGLKVLVDNAVVVNSSSPEINAPSNPYSGLETPPQVAAQILDIPSYEDLKTTEKDRRNSTNSPIDFNASSYSINTAADWDNYFPAPGTPDNPTVVNVTSGLNIPDGVNAANYIITVSGVVNFNGVSNLDNVVLVSDGGGINLGATQFNNSAVFAAGEVNMNNSARFSGNSVVASSANINFNGATVTTNEADELKVVAQGSITYNASLDSRATLLATGNVNFNGTTALHGFIGAQNDIVCNSDCSVVGVSNFVATPDLSDEIITVGGSDACQLNWEEVNAADPTGWTFTGALGDRSDLYRVYHHTPSNLYIKVSVAQRWNWNGKKAAPTLGLPELADDNRFVPKITDYSHYGTGGYSDEYLFGLGLNTTNHSLSATDGSNSVTFEFFHNADLTNKADVDYLNFVTTDIDSGLSNTEQIQVRVEDSLGEQPYVYFDFSTGTALTSDLVDYATNTITGFPREITDASGNVAPVVAGNTHKLTLTYKLMNSPTTASDSSKNRYTYLSDLSWCRTTSDFPNESVDLIFAD